MESSIDLLQVYPGQRSDELTELGLEERVHLCAFDDDGRGKVRGSSWQRHLPVVRST